ncbi:MAG: dockerin type I repeat-containing protein [Clostridia bacterium]|nr:dockerin type I repeat-containing protein [Clostridia bacterium]
MKKVICICLALLLLLPFGLTAYADDLPPIPLTTKKTRVAGDVNGDGSVGLNDVVELARHLAGGWNVTIKEDNADVNGDNRVDLKDVVLLRRYLAGGWNVTLK